MLRINDIPRNDRAVEDIPVTTEGYAAAQVVLVVLKSFAVFNRAALPHNKYTVVLNAATYSIGGHAAVDHAAVHGECAVFTFATAVYFHAAAVARNAADDRAAIHGECAVGYYAAVRISFAFDLYTAARAIVLASGLAAHDAAAVHSKSAARFNIHTAAVVAARVSAGDDAALNNLCAAGFIQHPEAIGIGGDIVFRGGAAVGEDQVAVLRNLDHAVVAAICYFEYMAVEVNGDFIVN